MRNITARRLLPFCASVLVPAGILLLVSSDTADSSNHPPKATVDSLDKITEEGATQHQTWWECIASRCLNPKANKPKFVLEGHEDNRDCTASECGHARTDYTDQNNWQYLGH